VKLVVYTAEETAEILKVSLDTIRNWVSIGKLKGSKIGGEKNIRVTEEAIRDFLTANEVKPKG